MDFMKIFRELEFDSRCKKLTSLIGAFAIVLTFTAVICRTAEPPIALRQLLALTGSLSACGMITCYAAMAAGAFGKVLPDKTETIFCAADSAALALKLFFLLATCGSGLPVACAALIIDAAVSRIYLLHLKKRGVQFN